MTTAVTAIGVRACPSTSRAGHVTSDGCCRGIVPDFVVMPDIVAGAWCHSSGRRSGATPSHGIWLLFGLLYRLQGCALVLGGADPVAASAAAAATDGGVTRVASRDAGDAGALRAAERLDIVAASRVTGARAPRLVAIADFGEAITADDRPRRDLASAAPGNRCTGLAFRPAGVPTGAAGPAVRADLRRRQRLAALYYFILGRRARVEDGGAEQPVTTSCAQLGGSGGDRAEAAAAI